MRAMIFTAIFLIVSFTTLPATLLASDTIPPMGKILINNGKLYTNNAVVTLTLSARDKGSGLSRMSFSNDNSSWSAPQRYAVRKIWILTSGNGLKTVYVKFSDKAGNWSNPYSASITLDTQGPSITVTSPTEGEVIR